MPTSRRQCASTRRRAPRATSTTGSRWRCAPCLPAPSSCSASNAIRGRSGGRGHIAAGTGGWPHAPPATLERQVQRMPASPKAEALVTNVAGQWLYLRNLAAANPDARTFPDFDDNLRQAFKRETELFGERGVQDDRRAPDPLSATH